jgi:hypothetical protein
MNFTMNDFTGLANCAVAGFTGWLAFETRKLSTETKQSLVEVSKQSRLMLDSTAAEIKQADYTAQLYEASRLPFITLANELARVYDSADGKVAEIHLANVGPGIALFARDLPLPEFYYYEGSSRFTAMAQPFSAVLAQGESVGVRFKLVPANGAVPVPSGSIDGRSVIAALTFECTNPERTAVDRGRLMFGRESLLGQVTGEHSLYLIDREIFQGS